MSTVKPATPLTLTPTDLTPGQAAPSQAPLTHTAPSLAPYLSEPQPDAAMQSVQWIPGQALTMPQPSAGYTTMMVGDSQPWAQPQGTVFANQMQPMMYQQAAPAPVYMQQQGGQMYQLVMPEGGQMVPTTTMYASQPASGAMALVPSNTQFVSSDGMSMVMPGGAYGMQYGGAMAMGPSMYQMVPGPMQMQLVPANAQPAPEPKKRNKKKDSSPKASDADSGPRPGAAESSPSLAFNTGAAMKAIRMGHAHANTSSAYLGVTWYKASKRWQARLCSDNKKYHLGYFATEIEAARAYDRAVIEHKGPNAPRNFADSYPGPTANGTGSTGTPTAGGRSVILGPIQQMKQALAQSDCGVLLNPDAMNGMLRLPAPESDGAVPSGNSNRKRPREDNGNVNTDSEDFSAGRIDTGLPNPAILNAPLAPAPLTQLLARVSAHRSNTSDTEPLNAAAAAAAGGAATDAAGVVSVQTAALYQAISMGDAATHVTYDGFSYPQWPAHDENGEEVNVAAAVNGGGVGAVGVLGTAGGVMGVVGEEPVKPRTPRGPPAEPPPPEGEGDRYSASHREEQEGTADADANAQDVGADGGDGADAADPPAAAEDAGEALQSAEDAAADMVASVGDHPADE